MNGIWVTPRVRLSRTSFQPRQPLLQLVSPRNPLLKSPCDHAVLRVQRHSDSPLGTVPNVFLDDGTHIANVAEFDNERSPITHFLRRQRRREAPKFKEGYNVAGVAHFRRRTA